MKEDDLMEYSELESDSEDKPVQKPRRPQDRTQGYPRSECFRVEKNLLVYGWVQFGNGHFKALLLILTYLWQTMLAWKSTEITIVLYKHLALEQSLGAFSIISCHLTDAFCSKSTIHDPVGQHSTPTEKNSPIHFPHRNKLKLLQSFFSPCPSLINFSFSSIVSRHRNQL